MGGVSVFKVLDLPAGFGTAILVLTLVLLLAPYLPSGDFGPIKIPEITPAAKLRLKYIGPLGFLVALAMFLPILPNSNNVRLTNPFGTQQILLDGNSILITGEEFASGVSNKSGDDLVYPQELFSIRNPKGKEGFKYELTTPVAYMDALSEKITATPDSFMESLESLKKSVISNDPVFRTAKIFRIFKTPALHLEMTPKSRVGPDASPKRLKEAKDLYNTMLSGAFNDLRKAAAPNEPVGANAVPDVSDLEKMLDQKGRFVKVEKNVFDEISILIADRRRFELLKIAAYRGRDIPASPLQFILSKGGGLPDFDIQSVKEASISSNNLVWGFYGRTQWEDVKLDGVPMSVVYYDFYRLYVMNSAYLYQITISYIPTANQPRRTWDDLLGFLQSLKISAK